MAKLTTPYVSKMDKACPHDYHPTPQLKRADYLLLNGEWDFCLSDSEHTLGYPEKILVPFPPESALSGIERSVSPDSYMHYRKRFNAPKGFKSDRVFLHFGAVDQTCTVHLNGTFLGSHAGGYIPFSFDITDLLTDGENEVTVTAHDALDHAFPYGKQKYDRGGMWYTPVSGIWQTVWLEGRPATHVKDIKITPYEKGVRIAVSGGAKHKKITL